MIIESFDDKSQAIINPKQIASRFKCDVCIVTFSSLIEEYVLKNFKTELVGESRCVSGLFPFYAFKYKNKTIGIFRTLLGAPASVGFVEDATIYVDVKKFVVFGSAGALDKDICYGKIMVPTYAYRDEGTSYHFMPPSDFVKINNSDKVESIFKKYKIPYVKGKVWTTDGFLMETVNKVKKRKEEGCIVVEMELAACQAVANHFKLELYDFLQPGDVLIEGDYDKTLLHAANHDLMKLEIGLKIIEEI